MGLFDLVGTTMSGWLTDRFDSRWLLLWYYGLRGLSLFSCHNSFWNGLHAALDLFCLLRTRLDSNCTANSKADVRCIRKRKGGNDIRLDRRCHQAGASLAAYGSRMLRDWLGNYTVPFVLAGFYAYLRLLCHCESAE